MTLQLIPTPVPADMANAVDSLAEGIKAGEVGGLALIVVLKNRRFFVDCFGSMARDPHAARGYTLALDDCLRNIAQRKLDTHTTR
jgi:hypothetical protein